MSTHAFASGSAAVEMLRPDLLKPYSGNARTHSRKQIKQIAQSIERFGFTNPVLVDDAGQIIAGHGRVAAATLLDLPAVPVLRLSHLSPAEQRAYVIADNRLAEKAGWDREILAIELQALVDLSFEVELTGFDTAEIDLVVAEAATNTAVSGPADAVPARQDRVVTTLGDVWVLGRHRLLCGNALEPGAYPVLLEGDQVQLTVTDPPYNVPIDGHVCGAGRVRHRDFAFASGEMSEAAFTRFLATMCGHIASHSSDGALAYLCMDWRHMGEMLAAGGSAFSELKNLIVWNKTNGGMGSFYRSKHELIFLWKVGNGRHVNNIELGRFGRNRTNVWDYPGVNAFGVTRLSDLQAHPTVKPVALVSDALLDASHRNGLVLDPFCGSGTILIAAEHTGRRARAIEFDPGYVDVAIRRWQAATGKDAVLAGTDQTFAERENVRAAAARPVLEG